MPIQLLADTTVSAETFTPIISQIQTQLTFGNIAAVIAAIVGAGIGFVFLWWGARKCVNAVSSAFKSGKIHF